MDNYKIDYSKLLGRIKEKYGTHKNFASVIGVSQAYLSKFFNHMTWLGQERIIIFCRALDIAIDEIPVYFFAI